MNFALAVLATVTLLVRTDAGEFFVEVDVDRAPVTAANFLRYVDAGGNDGGQFHRTVTLANQPDNAVKIEVVQAGRVAGSERWPAIPLERTSVTGLKHLRGTISMARNRPDTAVSDFFICLSDQPSLDFGGARNPDGQGFAAFGRVVRGMEVVERIHRAPNTEAQRLTPPVKIVSIARVPSP
jgi:peptidyl-prolyl cis-trans isomerase A (cyclophilin A)